MEKFKSVVKCILGVTIFGLTCGLAAISHEANESECPNPEDFSLFKERTDLLKKIDFLKKTALDQIFDSDKVKIATDIFKVAKDGDPNVKCNALAALNEIASSMVFSSSKDKIVELVRDL